MKRKNFSVNNQGIKDSTKVQSLITSNSPPNTGGKCGPSSLGPDNGSIFNPTKNINLLNKNIKIKNPLDFEKAQYKEKL